MKRVVISQPMYFPWAGMFAQMEIADVFIHYDDADYTRRSFLSRVQVKGAEGVHWLSVPVQSSPGTPMNAAQVEAGDHWRQKHLATLRQFLSGQPHAAEAEAMARDTLAQPLDTLAALNMHGMEQVAEYLGLAPQIRRSSEMAARGRASERLLALVQEAGGTHYVTGHGAANYLDHALFEKAGITVEYMVYAKKHYIQKYGDFTPYVTILDLIASTGKNARDYLCPEVVHWREFMETTQQ